MTKERKETVQAFMLTIGLIVTLLLANLAAVYA